MILIEPSFEIVTPFGSLTEQVGIQLLQFIERMARISHRSEDKQTDDTWRRFIQAVVLEHGDWSVVEHVGLTVIFRVDRAVAYEIRTHRLASYTMESTRFVNYGKKTDMEFVQPTNLKEGDGCVSNQFLWTNAIAESERTYQDLVRNGVRPQEARSVLPLCLASTIAVTSNLRNWRLFFMMRSNKEVHPDLRRVIDLLLPIFKQNIPLIYDDIDLGGRQIDNLKKPR